MDRTVLERKALAELREIASAFELTGYQRLKKADLIDLIVGAGVTGMPSPNGNGTTADGDDEAGRTSAHAEALIARRKETEEPPRVVAATSSDDERQRDTSGRDDDSRDDDSNRNRSKRDRRRKSRGSNNPQENLDEAEVREGVLDLLPEGYGFLRTTGYLAGNKDVYVSQSFVRRFNLRRGDLVRGPIRHNKGSDKFPALARIDALEGEPLEGNEGATR